MIEKTCRHCGKYFVKEINIDFCSWRCKNNQKNKGNIGAMSELMIAADLINKHYEVFRALSPATSTDLIIRKNNKLMSVEVKTAQYINEKYYFMKKNIKADILAFYHLQTNHIGYLIKKHNDWKEITL
jgi:Holliday junction resolvase